MLTGQMNTKQSRALLIESQARLRRLARAGYESLCTMDAMEKGNISDSERYMYGVMDHKLSLACEIFDINRFMDHDEIKKELQKIMHRFV